MPESPRCQEVRELIPELAMGVASGEARARGLAHLAGCAACRRDLEDAATTVDELLLLAPEAEPPAGFDSRVLAALDRGAPRGRLRMGLLAAAAAVLVGALVASLAWGRTADDRTLADQYREVLSIADGSYLRAADLKVGGANAGNVFAYQGQPSWVFVTVEDARSATYDVRVVTTAGRTLWIGSCTVHDGAGSWGATVDVPVQEIDRVEMYHTGLPTMVASLRH
jgi:hypothetical protein